MIFLLYRFYGFPAPVILPTENIQSAYQPTLREKRRRKTQRGAARVGEWGLIWLF